MPGRTGNYDLAIPLGERPGFLNQTDYEQATTVRTNLPAMHTDTSKQDQPLLDELQLLVFFLVFSFSYPFSTANCRHKSNTQ